MSLVYAAITPHPPLLIPSVGHEATKKLAKTKQALQRIEEDLYLSKPQVLVVISPHGKLLPDTFTINFCSEYQADLKDFGDLTTRLTFKGEMDLPYLLRASTKRQHLPAVMITEPRLDYGVSVPLYWLTPHLKEVAILPIGFTDLDAKAHFEFGTILKDQIINSNKRVAVIASADLSHTLKTEAPAGFNRAGAEFDIALQEFLANRNTAGILQLDPKLITAAVECGWRSILILLGILREVGYTYEAYNYESPFGVGYLTASFLL